MDGKGFLFLKKFLRLGHAFGVFPYKFVTERKVDEETEEVIVTQKWVYHKSTRRLVFLGIGFAAVGFNQCLLSFRAVQVFLDDNVPTEHKHKVGFLAGIYIIFNFANWIHIRYYGQHCHLFNAIVNTVNQFQKENTNEDESASRDLGQLFWLSIMHTFVLSIGRGLSAFSKPASPFYVTSLLSDPNAPGVRILGGAFHFYVTTLSFVVFTFYGVFPAWYSLMITPVIRQQREGQGQGQGQVEENFLVERKRYEIYNQLQVLQRHYDAKFGVVPLCVEIAYLFGAILNLFLFVVYKDYSYLVRALFVLALIKLTFTQLAVVFEESSNVLESWKASRAKRSPWFRKFQRSFRPLRVSVGGFFYIDKTFILTLFGIIIDQATTLILSHV